MTTPVPTAATTIPTPSTPSKRRIQDAALIDDHPAASACVAASGAALLNAHGQLSPVRDRGTPKRTKLDASSSTLTSTTRGTSTSKNHKSNVTAADTTTAPGTSLKSVPEDGSENALVQESLEANEPPLRLIAPDGRQIKVLPHEYMLTDQDDLIMLIASMLVKLIQHNDRVPLLPEHLTRFHSRSPPSISVLEYLRRIVKYTNIEKSPLLLLLPYLDAFCQHLPSFTLSSLTVHRFLISSACVASKALCDSFCTNAHYAKVGGIRVEELNLLERELVRGLGWKLVVEGSLLQDYYASLIVSHSSSAPHPPPAHPSPAPPVEFTYAQGPPPEPKPLPPPRPYLPWPSWDDCEVLFGRSIPG